MMDSPLTFEELLSHFPGARKPNGTGGFMVTCPVHADDKPSLSISPGNGSGPLFKCFADCRTIDILTAKGLDWQDILTPRDEPRIRKEDTRKPPAVAAPKPPPPKRTSPPGVFTRYEAKDSTGTLIGIHVREDHAGGKEFWWEQPDGTRGLGGRKLHTFRLYGIDRLSPDAKEVFLVEGEKATDALLSKGIAALGTVTGASGTPGDDALRPLMNRTVYLWPDNDIPGRGHMKRIGEALLRLGNRNVHMIDWKGAPEKGDAADLFALEGAADDFDALTNEAKPITVEVVPEVVEKTQPPLFVSVASLLDNPRKPTWLVRGLIETPSTTMLFGPPELGKSFLAVDLAVACALNGRWMDKRVTGGPVYYLAGEGHVGLERRFNAWQLHRGLERLPENLYLSTTRIALDVAGGLRVETEVERMSATTGTTPALIVVDTLARAFPPGKDENSAKDMGEFINEVDRIRTRFNCVAMLVHHTGHSDTHRARGSSSMRGAWDAELSVSMNGVQRVAQWTKLKDQPKDPTGREFALIPVVLGIDEDAEEGENPLITSCAVEWQGTTSARKDNHPTKTEILGLDTLRTALAGGEKTTGARWRVAFYKKHWGENDDTKQAAFRRVKASLAGKKLIEIDGYNYSILERRS
jgi:AAA domain